MILGQEKTRLTGSHTVLLNEGEINGKRQQR